MKRTYSLLITLALVVTMTGWSNPAHAATSPWLSATSDYNAWDDFNVFPTNYADKYRAVDDPICNGNIDGVWTTTVNDKQAFEVDLGAIPDGSIMTSITVRPCMGKVLGTLGNGSSTGALRIAVDGVGSNYTFYSFVNPTPTVQFDAVYSGMNIVKTPTTELLVGFRYFGGFGNQGMKVSDFEVQIEYN